MIGKSIFRRRLYFISCFPPGCADFLSPCHGGSKPGWAKLRTAGWGGFLEPHVSAIREFTQTPSVGPWARRVWGGWVGDLGALRICLSGDNNLLQPVTRILSCGKRWGNFTTWIKRAGNKALIEPCLQNELFRYRVKSSQEPGGWVGFFLARLQEG